MFCPCQEITFLVLKVSSAHEETEKGHTKDDDEDGDSIAAETEDDDSNSCVEPINVIKLGFFFNSCCLYHLPHICFYSIFLKIVFGLLHDLRMATTGMIQLYFNKQSAEEK